jgi:hypothetical protein
VAAVQVLALVLEFGQPHHPGQVGVQQPLLLALQLAEGAGHGLLAGLQFLGQPGPVPRPGQRAGGLGGVGQQRAQISPDQLVQPPGRDVAGGAPLSPGRAQRVGVAAAQVVPVACRVLPGQAPQPAGSAADQGAQQVLMPGAARRGLLVGIQLGLHLGEGLLGDDRRHRDFDPLLRRAWRVALARADRAQRGFALPGRGDPGAVGLRPAGMGRVAQDAAHAGHVPARLARRGGHPQIGQPLGELIQGCLRLEVRAEHLRDQRRLPGLDPHRGRIARPLRVQPVPERRPGPRQQHARPQLGQTATPHPLGDQRPLVLRDRPADLQQQLVVRVSAHRPVQELHPAAVPGKFLEQQHLVHVVARQPVRRGHQDHIKIGQCRMIAQPVQPRPAKAGAAIPVIPVDVLVIQLPAAPGNRRAQPVKLLLDSLRLRLAGRRDPGIHRDTHQPPPA